MLSEKEKNILCCGMLPIFKVSENLPFLKCQKCDKSLCIEGQNPLFIIEAWTNYDFFKEKMNGGS